MPMSSDCYAGCGRHILAQNLPDAKARTPYKSEIYNYVASRSGDSSQSKAMDSVKGLD